MFLKKLKNNKLEFHIIMCFFIFSTLPYFGHEFGHEFDCFPFGKCKSSLGIS